MKNDEYIIIFIIFLLLILDVRRYEKLFYRFETSKFDKIFTNKLILQYLW